MEEYDHRFHREINRAADSPKLTWSLATAARYVPRGLYGRLDDWPALAVRDHARVLAALRDGDARAATPRCAATSCAPGAADRPPRTPRHVAGGLPLAWTA